MSKKKVMILCWATFIAILGQVWPVGHRLDTPDWVLLWLCSAQLWTCHMVKTARDPLLASLEKAKAFK